MHQQHWISYEHIDKISNIEFSKQKQQRHTCYWLLEATSGSYHKKIPIYMIVYQFTHIFAVKSHDKATFDYPSQTCCIMLISFNLYCRWGRKHPSLWQPCCIFTFYLYRYTYLCYILQFQAQRYRPTKKRGQSQLKLPSICFWENFPTTKNVP